jgi:hypothetical protein
MLTSTTKSRELEKWRASMDGEGTTWAVATGGPYIMYGVAIVVVAGDG